MTSRAAFMLEVYGGSDGDGESDGVMVEVMVMVSDGVIVEVMVMVEVIVMAQVVCQLK